jgi:hypothetical protein
MTQIRRIKVFEGQFNQRSNLLKSDKKVQGCDATKD